MESTRVSLFGANDLLRSSTDFSVQQSYHDFSFIPFFVTFLFFTFRLRTVISIRFQYLKYSYEPLCVRTDK